MNMKNFGRLVAWSIPWIIILMLVIKLYHADAVNLMLAIGTLFIVMVGCTWLLARGG